MTIDPVLLCAPFLALPIIGLLRFIGCAGLLNIDGVGYIQPLAITSAPSVLPDGTVGVRYPTATTTATITLTATGGAAGHTWTSQDLGNLGLTLAPDGTKITGTPTSTYQGTVRIFLTDGAGTTAGPALAALHIAPIPLVITGPAGALLPEGAVSVPPVSYPGFTFSASRALVNPVWKCDLPSASGLSLDPHTGHFGGTPVIAQAQTPVSIDLHDDLQPAPGAALVVKLNVLGITTTSLPDGQVGVPYPPLINLTPVGAVGSVTWTSGPLDGLILDLATGLLHGTPTTSGEGNRVFTATDTSTGLSASRPIPLLITTSFPMFNSGFNPANGASYGESNPAANYTLKFLDAPFDCSPMPTAPIPAIPVVAIAATLPITADPTLAGQWISPNANANGLGFPPGAYSYATTFDLPAGFDPATASIAGVIVADNEATAVILNGVATTAPVLDPTDVNGRRHNFSFDRGSPFNAGINTLEFRIKNDPPACNPTGMQVVLTGMAVKP